MNIRRARTGIMLARPFEKRLLIQMKEIIIQPKINGLRSLISVVQNKSVELVSSTGKPIYSMPHIQKAYINYPTGIYDGELYAQDMKLQDIRSIVLRNDIHPEHESISHYLFDFKGSQIQSIRTTYLRDVFEYNKQGNSVVFVHHTRLSTENISHAVSQIKQLTKSYLDLGYEGSIIRDANALYMPIKTSSMLKLKPKSYDVYKVEALIQEVDQYGYQKQMIGALVVSDKDGRTFKVGSGLDHNTKRSLYEAKDKPLNSLYVLVRYPELTNKGIPFQPIFLQFMGTNISPEELKIITEEYEQDEFK